MSYGGGGYGGRNGGGYGGGRDGGYSNGHGSHGYVILLAQNAINKSRYQWSLYRRYLRRLKRGPWEWAMNMD